MNNDFFTLLKNKITEINNQENQKTLKEFNKGISKKNQANSMEELNEKIDVLINKLGLNDNESNLINYENLLKEKLLDQYEEEKDNITFATLIEKNNNTLIVSIIIFDNETTYSNLLVRTFNDDPMNLISAEDYFNTLKQMIIENDKNNLSKLILEKM